MEVLLLYSLMETNLKANHHVKICRVWSFVTWNCSSTPVWLLMSVHWSCIMSLRNSWTVALMLHCLHTRHKWIHLRDWVTLKEWYTVCFDAKLVANSLELKNQFIYLPEADGLAFCSQKRMQLGPTSSSAELLHLPHFNDIKVWNVTGQTLVALQNIVHIRSTTTSENGIGHIWKIRIGAVQAVIKETDMGRIWAESLPRPVAIVCRPIERSMKAITIIFLTSINCLNEGVLIYTRKKIMLRVRYWLDCSSLHSTFLSC